MTVLYKLAEEYRELASAIDDDGEVAPDVGAALDRVNAEIAVKVDNAVLAWANANATAKSLREEAGRLSARAALIEGRATAVKAWMQGAMSTIGLQKISTGTHTLFIQRNPPSVVIDVEPEFVPEDYAKVTVSPDKRKIAEALKGGAALSFAHLEQTEGLRIK